MHECYTLPIIFITKWKQTQKEIDSQITHSNKQIELYSFSFCQILYIFFFDIITNARQTQY